MVNAPPIGFFHPVMGDTMNMEDDGVHRLVDVAHRARALRVSPLDPEGDARGLDATCAELSCLVVDGRRALLGLAQRHPVRAVAQTADLASWELEQLARSLATADAAPFARRLELCDEARRRLVLLSIAAERAVATAAGTPPRLDPLDRELTLARGATRAAIEIFCREVAGWQQARGETSPARFIRRLGASLAKLRGTGIEDELDVGLRLELAQLRTRMLSCLRAPEDELAQRRLIADLEAFAALLDADR